MSELSALEILENALYNFGTYKKMRNDIFFDMALEQLQTAIRKLEEQGVEPKTITTSLINKPTQPEHTHSQWRPYPTQRPERTGYYIIRQHDKLDSTEAVECYFYNDTDAFPWNCVKWWCEIPR